VAQQFDLTQKIFNDLFSETRVFRI